MKKLIKILTGTLLLSFMCVANGYCDDTLYVSNVANYEEIYSPIDIIAEVPEPEIIFSGTQMSDEEIDLIALITMAEAEGECETGQRLVIDTILNRLESEHFPDSVQDVVYQKNQFSSVHDGRVNRCYVMNDIRDLVVEELAERTNEDVMFFTAGKYGQYGKPMFPVGNHYFSEF